MPTNARSARGQQRRTQILDAASELFASPGYHTTSLRDIAAHIDMSHAGLLRHYASKGEILQEVIRRVETRLRASDTVQDASGDALAMYLAHAEAAEQNPHLIALTAIALGAASTTDHPGHAYFSNLLATQIADSAASIARRPDLGAGRDPEVEGRLFHAVWNGLQLGTQFDPEHYAFAEMLHRYADSLSTDRVVPSAGAHPAAPSLPTPEEPDRRESIIWHALTLFARRGYIDTTMREIAEASDVAKSTLFHHFASKQDILIAVLSSRIGASAAELLAQAEIDARATLISRATRMGSTERLKLENAVAGMLCHEAATSDHPAHELISVRLKEIWAIALQWFTLAQRQGSLDADRDPSFEASMYVAVSTGLHLQRLYEGDAVDAAGLLEDYLRGFLRVP